MDLSYRAETKCGKFEFLSYLKCYELHIYIKRYSSCALTSMTNNIGLLFCLRLVGLLVWTGPLNSPRSIKSSADICGHLTARNSSILMGSIDWKKKELQHEKHNTKSYQIFSRVIQIYSCFVLYILSGYFVLLHWNLVYYQWKASLVSERLKYYPRVSEISLSCTFCRCLILFLTFISCF